MATLPPEMMGAMPPPGPETMGGPAGVPAPMGDPGMAIGPDDLDPTKNPGAAMAAVLAASSMQLADVEMMRQQAIAQIAGGVATAAQAVLAAIGSGPLTMDGPAGAPPPPPGVGQPMGLGMPPEAAMQPMGPMA